MIDEGVGAPPFELPAVVGGEIEQVALSDYRGSDVVILAFYPGDFNPACDGEQTDLDELDLFTMQKDVSILAISADSVFSHRAFADDYDLHIPLLADAVGGVAEDYGVAVDDPEAGYRTKRAVAVIGPGGDVEYAWSTDDLDQLPPVDRVREAVDSVGGSETALARYRVGHARYVEGRRAFTSAMQGFGDEEWMMAQSDFRRAHEEFEEAAAQFNTAVRFGEDDVAIAHFERAEDKAELLWQAAEWLTDAANAFASGEGARGQSMRQDAGAPLEEARRYGEPLDPDDFPPEEAPPPIAAVEDGPDTFLSEDDEEIDTSLDVDIDEGPDADEDLRESIEAGQDTGGDGAREPADAAGDGTAAAGATDVSTESSSASSADGDDEADGEDSIDEAELEEITAELEQQTEAARAGHDREMVEPETDGEAADATEAGGPDESQDGAATDGEAVELDLTDPTGGEGLDPLDDDEDGGDDEDDEDEGDEEDTDELGDGGHGVPDSL